jgi:hypothetical protein
MRTFVLAVVAWLAFVLPVRAAQLAYDDAASPAYSSGPYAGLNGGFGLTMWQHTLPAFPASSGGPLHAYVSTSAANDPIGPPLPDIDTAGTSGPVAWGNNADPTGHTFMARRSLTFDLPIGGTLAISMDNGDVDGQETISFGLNAQVMCQFFFDPNTDATNYQFTDTLSAVTSATTLTQTWGGVRLTLTRETASTYSLAARRLEDNAIWSTPLPLAYNTSTITGIRTITITNADGGAGLGHSMYVNAIEATDGVPEPAALAMLGLLAPVIAGRHHRSRAGR